MDTACKVDEGLISGTLVSKTFRQLLHLPGVDTPEYASIEENIAFIVHVESVGGAGL